MKSNTKKIFNQSEITDEEIEKAFDQLEEEAEEIEEAEGDEEDEEVEKANYDKVSAADAIEAGKQLDRLEHKLVENPIPSNIQIVYGFDALNGSLGRNAGNKDRLSTPTDPVGIPSESEEVSPL